mmetsp:Transcript_6515/g.5756  ORF Transcript_6515/g.5756 Transcript_6515/m.5756 type:complete len:83 (-) Transcript_6515:429-677(-)
MNEYHIQYNQHQILPYTCSEYQLIQYQPLQHHQFLNKKFTEIIYMKLYLNYIDGINVIQSLINYISIYPANYTYNTSILHVY